MKKACVLIVLGLTVTTGGAGNRGGGGADKKACEINVEPRVDTGTELVTSANAAGYKK